MAPEKLLLAAPRGYCAGVDRAVQTVERALELYGAPVYVRKEIVHNKHVVEELRARGAIFVDELEDAIPEGAISRSSPRTASPAGTPTPPGASCRRSTPPARSSPRSTARR
jgi:4-hydroxy-3-methylbut-2-enyl diphosphate reductase